jgi:hypothetical protein
MAYMPAFAGCVLQGFAQFGITTLPAANGRNMDTGNCRGYAEVHSRRPLPDEDVNLLAAIARWFHQAASLPAGTLGPLNHTSSPYLFSVAASALLA